ncbi:MAG: DUF2752 domain-containing protein [Planctomycetota bacterium]
MNASRGQRSASITWRARIWLTALAIAGLALLAAAWSLTPDERGLGTHEQLGLAPCWIHARFGVVCPSCGMTTAWAHAMRGQIGHAAACNAGGLLLWVVATTATPWCLFVAARGRWPWQRPSPRALLWCGTALLLVTLADWFRRVLTT